MTVYIRAVSVKTGEVLTTVTASKTITSYALDANVFRYVGSTTMLEAEGGFTTNEPALIALQAAIDKATYGVIMEGVDLKLWSFADPAAGWPSVWRYNQERDGLLSARQVIDAEHGASAGMVTPRDRMPTTRRRFHPRRLHRWRRGRPRRPRRRIPRWPRSRFRRSARGTTWAEWTVLARCSSSRLDAPAPPGAGK